MNNYQGLLKDIANVIKEHGVICADFSVSIDNERISVEMVPERTRAHEYSPASLRIRREQIRSESDLSGLVRVIGKNVDFNILKNKFPNYRLYHLKEPLIGCRDGVRHFIQSDASELNNYQEILSSLKNAGANIEYEVK